MEAIPFVLVAWLEATIRVSISCKKIQWLYPIRILTVSV